MDGKDQNVERWGEEILSSVITVIPNSMVKLLAGLCTMGLNSIFNLLLWDSVWMQTSVVHIFALSAVGQQWHLK